MGRRPEGGSETLSMLGAPDASRTLPTILSSQGHLSLPVCCPGLLPVLVRGTGTHPSACDPDLHPPCPIPSQGLECFQCYGVLDLSLCHPSPTPCRLKAAPPLWSLALPMGRNSATLARAVPRPCAQIMNLTHPVVPGGSYPIETEDGLIDLKTEKLDMTCCEKSLCNRAATVQRGLWGLSGSSCSAWASSFGPCCEPSPPWHCPGG
ncbi:PREDICTED: uncharacterized protein LOC108536557 [Rhinopithecus bieti]|uniref:uncharacterized protein LOC108536557 n=1 Tax=Rhinopithecus bieti TaxID=61621 RepID=UPI00083C25A6|nr:PREDICTED: uncharacterized protein LOC108536557 [Rhinopithecus bieti]